MHCDTVNGFFKATCASHSQRGDAMVCSFLIGQKIFFAPQLSVKMRGKRGDLDGSNEEIIAGT